MAAGIHKNEEASTGARFLCLRHHRPAQLRTHLNQASHGCIGHWAESLQSRQSRHVAKDSFGRVVQQGRCQYSQFSHRACAAQLKAYDECVDMYADGDVRRGSWTYIYSSQPVIPRSKVRDRDSTANVKASLLRFINTKNFWARGIIRAERARPSIATCSSYPFACGRFPPIAVFVV
jgi:hypothetical protein